MIECVLAFNNKGIVCHNWVERLRTILIQIESIIHFKNPSEYSIGTCSCLLKNCNKSVYPRLGYSG